MKLKIFLSVLFLWCLSFGQDTLSSVSIDTIIKIDTISVHDTIKISAEKCRYVLKIEQKTKIDSIFNISKNTKDSIPRQKIYKTADSALKLWLTSYPEESRYLKQRSILRGSGIMQIVFGVIGIVFVVVDPQSEKSFFYDVPSTINSKGVVTATKKQEVKYKTGWAPYHTGILLLSSGIIISGIITVNF